MESGKRGTQYKRDSAAAVSPYVHTECGCFIIVQFPSNQESNLIQIIPP